MTLQGWPAVMYLTTEADLRQAIETAAVHCRPGGVAVFVPDFVRETFAPGTDSPGSWATPTSPPRASWP